MCSPADFRLMDRVHEDTVAAFRFTVVSKSTSLGKVDAQFVATWNQLMRLLIFLTSNKSNHFDKNPYCFHHENIIAVLIVCAIGFMYKPRRLGDFVPLSSARQSQ